MLVPLTDPDNAYSKVMLDLIADQKPYPSSPYPRRFSEIVEPSISRRRVTGRTTVALGALVIGLVLVAKVAS